MSASKIRPNFQPPGPSWTKQTILTKMEQSQEQGDDKDEGGGGGEGDAYLLRAIDHLLTLDGDSRDQSISRGDADDRDDGDGEEGAEERLLSALLLVNRLGSADNRRRLLNGSHDDNNQDGVSEEEGGGPALGWFALALLRQYVQDPVGVGSTGDVVGEEEHADEKAGDEDEVSLALLRLAVRSVSLLYAELPPTSPSAPASASSSRTTKDFHSTCLELLRQVLQRRSEQELAMRQVDVEAAATLTLLDQKGMVDRSSVGDGGIRCAEVMLRRYCSSMTRIIAPSPSPDNDGAAASKVDGDQEQEQPSADAMMVQLIQSVLGESSSSVTNNDDEADANHGGGWQRQYARIVAHCIGALLDRGEESSDAFFVSEEIFAGLLELATPKQQSSLASQNTAIFLPIALRCIAVGANLGSRGIRTSYGFDLVHSLVGETGSINTKVAPAILRLFLSSLAWPENDLTSREQIYRAIAALSGDCGLRWMANVNVVDESSTESDLGAAAACCTLIRLAAGELRIALGWILGDDDEKNAKEDPRTSMIYMNIVKDCLSICQAALRLMLDLSEDLDDEDFHLPTDFGPFAHLARSPLDP